MIVFTGVTISLAWYAADLLLLTFAAVLVAAFLRGLSAPIASRTALSPRAALLVVLLVILAVVGGMGVFLATDVVAQMDQLAEELPQALMSLEATFRTYEPAARLLDQTARVEDWILERRVLSRASSLVSSTLALLSGLGVVVFMSIFIAFDPELYVRGIVILFQPHRRARVREVLDTIGGALRWWLVGKSIEMLLLAVVTWLGLHVLGLQPALALGVIAGLLAFVPYLGPMLAILPALLLAIVQGPTLVLQVLALYGGIQLLESNLLTPLMERKTVHLPPALTIFAQVLFALLFGFLGVLVASPLTAVGLVLVKMLYVEDVLGEDADAV